jgi:sigma-B regulation protein RsbU (phosphoserine phosphatase)
LSQYWLYCGGLSDEKFITRNYMKKIYLIVSLIIISIISAYIIYKLYPSVHPLGAVKLKYNQLQIEQKGESMIDNLNIDAENKIETTTLQGNSDLIKSIYDSHRFDEANEILRSKVPGYYWELDWKSSEEKVVINGENKTGEDLRAGDVRLNYDTDGNLLGFKREISDSVELKPVDEDSARQMALSFLRKYAPVVPGVESNAAKYKVVNSFTEQSTKKSRTQLRTDYSFSWIARSSNINNDIEIKVAVSGDMISEYNLTYKVPENVSQAHKSIYSVATEVPFYIVVYILILIIGYKRIRAYEVSFRLAVIMGLIVGISFSINLYTMIADSATGWELWLPLIFSTIFLAAGLFISWAVSETVAREAWKEKFVSLDLLTKGYAFHSKVGTAGIIGLTGGFMIYLVWMGLLFVSERIYNISFIIKDSTSLVSQFHSVSPALNVINMSIYPEIYITAIFLLFVYSGLKRRFNSLYLLIPVSALIWGLVNFNELVPIYWGVITGTITGALFILLFHYYDVLAALLSLVVYNIIDLGISLFTNGNTYYLNSGYYLSLVFVLLAVFLIIGLLTRDKITDFDSITPAFVKNITERQRMQRELEIARDVQMSFLPVKDPRFRGLDIAAKCIPALEVGGDYYDFVKLDENRFGIIIGDVSGKGTQAAFYMTLAKGFVKALSKTIDSPAEFLIKLNELFYENVERGTFISMIYGIFDSNEKTLTFARAGHNPVLARQSNKKEIELLNPVGLALGLEKGKIFNKTIKEIKIDMKAGDTFVFYTDGFTEAMNKYKIEFTEERLKDSISKHIDLPANELLQKIIDDVNSFIGKTFQHDDMTIVVVKILK